MSTRNEMIAKLAGEFLLRDSKFSLKATGKAWQTQKLWAIAKATDIVDTIETAGK